MSSAINGGLVSDLNALSHIIFSNGGYVIDLNMERQVRQLILLVEAEAEAISALLASTAMNIDKIVGVFLLGHQWGQDGDGFGFKVGAPDFLPDLRRRHAKIIQVYPQ
ncbi:MAG: hypothetical protein ACKN9T_13010 [Candidatus Methylumidiphilus sp.]